MAIYRIIIHKSFGGRAAHDKFSNTYDIVSDEAINSPELATIATSIKEAERSSTLDEVHFLSAHIKQVAENLLNQPADRFQTVEFEDRGARAVPAGDGAGAGQFDNPILTQDRVLVVKRKSNEGRTGQMKFRGMLLHDDVVTNLDGGLELKDENGVVGPNDGPIPVVAGLNALIATANFVLINPPNLLVQTSRPVTLFTFGGIGTKQLHQRKTSADKALASAQARQVSQIISRARRLIGSGTVGDLAGAALATFLELKVLAQAAFAALPVTERIALTGAMVLFA